METVNNIIILKNAEGQTFPTTYEEEGGVLMHEALHGILANTEFPEDTSSDDMYDALANNITFVALENRKSGRYPTAKIMVLVCHKAHRMLFEMFRDELTYGF